jgi:hypothetical protein
MSSEIDHIDRRASIDDRRNINIAGLLELLDQHNRKHDEAHRRLREDLRELELKIVEGLKQLIEKQQQNSGRIDTLVNTPVDAAKLMLTPRIVFTIVVVVLSISVSFWASNSGLRSDVRDILTRMASEQRVSDANAKLLEVNNVTIKTALDNNTREMKDSLAIISKRQDLLTLQYNELNSQLTRLTARGEK